MEDLGDTWNEKYRLRVQNVHSALWTYKNLPRTAVYDPNLDPDEIAEGELPSARLVDIMTLFAESIAVDPRIPLNIVLIAIKPTSYASILLQFVVHPTKFTNLNCFLRPNRMLVYYAETNYSAHYLDFSSVETTEISVLVDGFVHLLKESGVL